ncbi:MAG: hypothetical protein FVQ84_22820 [Planctomycetes bacterium]|nr:hypothetical protein [Planctomycetota bacterium]
MKITRELRYGGKCAGKQRPLQEAWRHTRQCRPPTGRDALKAKVFILLLAGSLKTGGVFRAGANSPRQKRRRPWAKPQGNGAHLGALSILSAQRQLRCLSFYILTPNQAGACGKAAAKNPWYKILQSTEHLKRTFPKKHNKVKPKQNLFPINNRGKNKKNSKNSKTSPFPPLRNPPNYKYKETKNPTQEPPKAFTPKELNNPQKHQQHQTPQQKPTTKLNQHPQNPQTHTNPAPKPTTPTKPTPQTTPNTTNNTTPPTNPTTKPHPTTPKNQHKQQHHPNQHQQTQQQNQNHNTPPTPKKTKTKTGGEARPSALRRKPPHAQGRRGKGCHHK